MTEELLKALQLIKSVCENNNDCDGCPMLNEYEECGVTKDLPSTWALKKREVWF